MNIVHFSITPLAGAPIRLVENINRYSEHSARLVDLERYGSEDFGQDVVFAETPELAFELVRKADVIHLHNYLDEGSIQFYPIDFAALRRQGKAIIRQFHSHPQVVADKMGIGVNELHRHNIPSLVVGQFQERYYPEAMVVPNIIPLDDALHGPSSAPATVDVCYSPTRCRGAWTDRWNSKGRPEIEGMLSSVCQPHHASWQVLHKRPLREVLAVRQRSRIVVDDLVTGSYHLTGLEGLSQGKAVLAFLDGRAERVLRHFAGTASNPFLNVRLEDAAGVLEYLLEHPDATRALGVEARHWMERHWSPGRFVEMLSAVYAQLVDDPSKICRQRELSLDDEATRFHACILPDLVHASRRQRATGQDPLHAVSSGGDQRTTGGQARW